MPSRSKLNESTRGGGDDGAGARYNFSSSPTVDCHDGGLLWKLPPPHIGAIPITIEGEHWELTYNTLSWPPVFFGSCPHLALAPARSQPKRNTLGPAQSQLKESTGGSPTIGRNSRLSSLEAAPFSHWRQPDRNRRRTLGAEGVGELAPIRLFFLTNSILSWPPVFF